MSLRRIAPTLLVSVALALGLYQFRPASVATAPAVATEGARAPELPAGFAETAATLTTVSRGAVPAGAAFAAWLQSASPPRPAERAAWIEQGRRLAQARRDELKALIRRDPEAALAAALPEAERARVPAELTGLLETRFSGEFAYEVVATCALDPRLPTIPLARSLRIDGTLREVHTWGDRLATTSKRALRAYGIHLDEVAAVAPDPVRELSVAEARSRAAGSATLAAPIIAEEAGQVITFASRAALIAYREAWRRAEQEPGPDILTSLVRTVADELLAAEIPGSPLDPIAAAEEVITSVTPSGPPRVNAYTHGAKTLLVIRARFSDEAANYEPITLTQAQSAMGAVQSHFAQSSYGQLTLALTFTATVNLPHASSASSENSFSSLLSAATNAARSANPAWGREHYDHYVVITSNRSGAFSYAGRAYTGSPGAHVVSNYASLRTLGHEFGHNLGLLHAAYYRTDSPSPTGRDTLDGGYVPDLTNSEWIEYGHRFSLMSAQSGAEFDHAAKPHFSGYEKMRLTWLDYGYGIAQIRDPGIYRLVRLEAPGTSGLRSLVIDRPGTDYTLLGRRYWLNYRRGFDAGTAGEHLPYGVQLDWGPLTSSSFGAPQIDATPFSRGNSTTYFNPNNRSGAYWTIDNGDKEDGVLRVGRTLSDTAADIHLTPVATGGSAGAEYIDVRVVLDSTGNQPPTAALALSDLDAAPGAPVTFSVSASDPDGDPLHYSWEFEDNLLDPDHLNQPVATRSWSTAGRYTVRVIVSDGRGGLAGAKAVVTIGSPAATGVLWGRVLWGGLPVAGARIAIADTHQTWTLPDGTYALAGLTPGTSYALTAAAPGLTLEGQFPASVTASDGMRYGFDFHALETRLPALGELTAGTRVTVSPFEAAAPAGTSIQYLATVWDLATGLPLSTTTNTWTATFASVNASGLVVPNLAGAASTVSALVAGTTGFATLVAADSPLVPSVSLTADQETATEGQPASLTFEVARTGDLSNPLAVNAVREGNAQAGTDFTAPGLTVNFAAGVARVTLAFPLVNDVIGEGDETLTVRLGSGSGYALAAPSQATTTIIDDDGYAAWSAAATALQPDFGGPGYDFDGDLLSNLVEYALGLDPLRAESTLTTGTTPGAPRMEISGGQLVLTYVCDTRRTDVTCVVQSSSNLNTWTTVPHTVLATSGPFQQRRAAVPITTSPVQVFLHLLVTPLP